MPLPVPCFARCARSGGASVDAYGRLPSIEQAALSPDGTKIAFVKTTQDWRVLAIIDLNEEKLVGGVRSATQSCGRSNGRTMIICS